MKRAFTASTLLILVLLAIAFGCRSAGTTPDAQDQMDIGARMARMNLWREAMFRFKRAVQMEPDNAQAHSNLAVAYEANGDFENAAREYREALRLDRTNQHIQKNYSRFIEFTSRSKKRQQPKTAATDTATMSVPTSTGTPVTSTGTTSTAPPAPPLPPVTGTQPPVPPLTPPTDTTTTTPPPGGFR